MGLLSDLSSLTLILAFAIALLAGLVKGVVGFALPLILVSGLGSIMDPKLALAGIIAPVLLSNLLQTLRKGAAVAVLAARDFWRYLLIVCIAILIAAQGVALVSSQVFYLILGVPVVGLTLLQLAGWRLNVAPHNRKRAEWVVGLVSGIFGGLAGTWGPTTVLYLMAIDTPRDRQMVVQGVIYGVGSLALFLGHLQSGILNSATAPFSVALIVPSLLGMAIGFRLQDRLDHTRFRKVTLAVLLLAGVNLIRKGLMG
ncbi:sulfite exporter TauE/SafE family protein [Actibacterium ureilyticum]|uniref:sulfite exporter TauE/SafE family protein n=1 Tax=Actibacterium ureilyticum TaxID=1590614 RepID=UPI000BAACE8F|nr:sulfite exporter TauE/SafE family protein [Actibacterium ureilyticum]